MFKRTHVSLARKANKPDPVFDSVALQPLPPAPARAQGSSSPRFAATPFSLPPSPLQPPSGPLTSRERAPSASSRQGPSGALFRLPLTSPAASSTGLVNSPSPVLAGTAFLGSSYTQAAPCRSLQVHPPPASQHSCPWAGWPSLLQTLTCGTDDCASAWVTIYFSASLVCVSSSFLSH